ncbi:hypothetical protein PQU92_10220 [Asticcacaulis sp. BYS171W]|uniref:Uncharacterized protein n=1 Tax=Asticcacaulis aquaticus TaxID=2984212 RepID=A0ABT5HUD2_9CAUL|nr:hypothetical protein [Asticcacaulis aquaticus]MDC7683654.1 hypothetical protein [Asticcacaulis aquaticus]
MAKAVFHRHQRVYVEPVGTWAIIDKVNPVWAKGFEEPVRVTYDCGLGREFRAEELTAESEVDLQSDDGAASHQWRLMRAKNKWQTPENCAHHPFPGTYPIVVTDPNDWGGWRVPGAEYDRDPALIEMQARLIAAAPRFMRLAKDLTDYVKSEGDDLPDALIRMAKRFDQLRKIVETQAPDAYAKTTPQDSDSPEGSA